MEQNYYTTYVKSDLLRYTRNKTVSPDRSAKDPIHGALKDYVQEYTKAT